MLPNFYKADKNMTRDSEVTRISEKLADMVNIGASYNMEIEATITGCESVTKGRKKYTVNNI